MRKHDKQLNIEHDLFEFVCPYCNSTNLDVRPLGKTYVEDKVSCEGLDEEVAEKFKDTLTLPECLLRTEPDRLLFHCEDCCVSFTPTRQIEIEKFRKWIKNKYGQDCLGSMKEI